MKKYIIVVITGYDQDGKEICGFWNGERIAYGSYAMSAKVYHSYTAAENDASIIDGIDGYRIKEIS